MTTVTIQRTSKRLKAWLIKCNVIQFLGICMLFVKDMQLWGICAIAFGIAAHVVVRALIWWNHD
jgi:hypothetical protein